MADVVIWPHPTSLDLPPERVLTAATEKSFEGVVVLGFLKDGGCYMASSYADGGTVSWLMDRAKYLMHKQMDEQD